MKKKLIEVALPLEAINRESAREKSIRHGHPSTLHLWWARRPLASARAVLFASLVDDPSSHPDRFPTEETQEAERQRLFGIIEKLVKWENSNNEEVLAAARREIERSTGGAPPPVLDPFCGGGSIPLEAQRLGLEVHASDLNPVAVLITKALVEIPPRFRDRPPVHPNARRDMAGWRGAQGLAEDVRQYGAWMREEAARRIGHLYPKVRITQEMAHGRPDLKKYVGRELTVIAWLWARTVKCPNPACGCEMPLVRSFALSTKKHRKAWVEPVVDGSDYRFVVRTGDGKPLKGTVDRRGARCIACDTPVPFKHIRAEGKAGRMGARLMAIVAEGDRERVYLSPIEDHTRIARSAEPTWRPDAPISHWPGRTNVVEYGLDNFGKLFTPRQLVALTTFSDLVGEARERVLRDALAAGMEEGAPLAEGGTGARAYADAVGIYLGIAVSRLSDIQNSLCRWEVSKTQVRNLFGRQAIPMVWDFAENNVFGNAAGDYSVSLGSLIKAMRSLPIAAEGKVEQSDAENSVMYCSGSVVSTDPPYYDNIGYADLSDFFYVWLRRSLREVYPNLFRTVLTPKNEELVATPYRFGGDKQKAREHFEKGLRAVFRRMREHANPGYPVTLYYAFKQSETKDDGEGNGETASTGWETMLEGLIGSGFQITATWPMRTELKNKVIAIGANVLASSIVLACRPRPEDAERVGRADFLRALRRELPAAIRTLQHGSIAPVDLAQAAIGPGMAVFSRYREVLEDDGSRMRVRTALALINEVLDEVLSEQEGEYDADTRWALAWFEQHGYEAGPYGEAEVLATARNVAVGGLQEAGILEARAGKVRLLRREELEEPWDPRTDPRLPVWELAQRIAKAHQADGEAGAAAIVAAVGLANAEVARDLAYRLYTLCERKGWAEEALVWNALGTAWPSIVERAGEAAEGAGGDAGRVEDMFGPRS